MKIKDYSKDYYEENLDDDDDDCKMPYYCQKCTHNEDWPECVIECRKWRAEL